MGSLPTGTVTFMLTDIEGSTALWEAHPAAMQAALARHDSLLFGAITHGGGHLVKARGEGDSLFAVFARASDAAAVACIAQRALAAEPWPDQVRIRVRMAVHTGEAELWDGDYYGSAVNRCARLRSIGHGGQILLSDVTADLVRGALPDGASVRGLGAHRLKDLTAPEHVFQLLHPDLPSEFAPLRSLESLPNNLPVQLTRFIGREQEMAEVRRLLGAGRLLTLTGPGGTGKTRLVLQVAAELLEEYPDGVWVVAFESLADESLVSREVAAALRVREEPGRSTTAVLTDHLREKRTLLVLDNCEHLVAACARLADALLRSCPRLSMLTTSREPLSVPGETTWQVPTLALPNPRQLPPLASLTMYEAVQLFIDRGRAAVPGFAVTNENAAAVAEICHRLDGIPLAIELAAARVKVLAPEQIARRLNDRFRLLTGGHRTLLPRQQTLRALVDWSYGLLTDRERLLWQRLSVFVGGFRLEAAEAVAEGDGIEAYEVLDLLGQLVEKSLVIAEERGGTTRYRLLETIRQFGAEKLAESGEQEAVRGRHRDWFVALTDQASPHLYEPHEATWHDRLEEELDNLRAAFDWSLREPGGAVAGLRMAVSLWPFWFLRGHVREGAAQLKALLARPEAADSGPERAGGLVALGYCLAHLGDPEGGYVLMQDGIALARRLSCRELLARMLGCLIKWEQELGNRERVEELLAERLTLFREQQNEKGMLAVQNETGLHALQGGDLEPAASVLGETLKREQELGFTHASAVSMRTLGYLAELRGEYARALQLYREATTVSLSLSDLNCLSYGILGVARAFAFLERHEDAARLFGAAATLRKEIGLALLSQWMSRQTDAAVAAARAALGDAAFAQAEETGRAMPFAAAVAFAHAERPGS
jgi:predicted ATPase/class 3 adenylate cyclase